MVRYDLVFRPVDQEGWYGVGAETEVGERGDAGYEVGGGGRGPGFAVRGTDTIEEEREAVAVFKKRKDELGAGIARAHPA